MVKNRAAQSWPLNILCRQSIFSYERMVHILVNSFRTMDREKWGKKVPKVYVNSQSIILTAGSSYARKISNNNSGGLVRSTTIALPAIWVILTAAKH